MSDRRSRGQTRVSAAYRPDDDPTPTSDSDGGRWRLMVFLLIVGSIFGYAGYDVATTPAFDPDVAEAAAVETINNARAESGLSRLSTDAELGEYAYGWSEEMAANGFRHGEPVCETGGENIAMRGSEGKSAAEIGEAVGKQWLNSPPHRETIMSNEWDATAVGIVKTGGDVYATQQFCG